MEQVSSTMQSPWELMNQYPPGIYLHVLKQMKQKKEEEDRSEASETKGDGNATDKGVTKSSAKEEDDSTSLPLPESVGPITPPAHMICYDKRHSDLRPALSLQPIKIATNMLNLPDDGHSNKTANNQDE
jgi:hypothetical protein